MTRQILRRLCRLAAVGWGALGLAAMGASACRAQVSVLSGGEMTTLCTLAAIATARNDPAIGVCTQAIDSEGATGRNLAGLYVNRGVLRLRAVDLSSAQKDFDIAVSIAPELGEAWVDRGAAMIAQHQWRAGVDDIDRGLPLKPTEPEKAYYNRAIAREHLDDVRGAYLDYMEAQTLAPAWTAPKAELARFSVTTR